MTNQSRREFVVALLFLLPNFVGFMVFLIIPAVGSFFISMSRWRLIDDPSWAGLQNFVELIRDDRFWLTLRNTATYALVRVPVNIAISLVLAVLLNQELVGRELFRTILFLPVVLSIVATAVMWLPIVESRGLLNSLLRHVGLGPVPWITSSRWAMPTVIIIGVWKEIGYYLVIFLAGLQGIPSMYYEASRIDGASKVQQFFRITFPLISPTTFFVFTVATIQSFQVFALTTVLTAGGPANATNTLVMYIYQSAFRNFRMGYASALAVMLFIIVLTITLVQKKLSTRWVHT